MKTTKINVANSYDVIIGKGLLEFLGRHVRDTIGNSKLCLVTDDKVDELYSARAISSLESAGYIVEKFIIPNGEKSKNTATLVSLLEFLAENNFSRSDAIIALGGGVVGDIAGFGAGIYMRGIRFVQIPTTLLAAVDSSVGGKTAVDLTGGKNLVGVFHRPSLVLCDTATLDTLEPSTFADGCAEIVKCAVICDKELFSKLENDFKNEIEQIITTCVSHKAKIVDEDEFDRGTRQLLNLGHTFAHAIETLSNFEISHGSAVAIGITTATKLAMSLGLCRFEELDRLTALLSTIGLPTKCPYSADELAKAMLADKKRAGDLVTLILPHGIGQAQPHKIKICELESYVERAMI